MSRLRRCLYTTFLSICRRNVPTSRLASTSSSRSHPNCNPYPYPSHRNPTPHQIFHLPVNATEDDIKTRYYDLVRIYHPDKASLAEPPEIAHARFQAISAAYDALRKKSGWTDNIPARWAREGFYPTAAAWRAASQARRVQDLYSGKTVDDRWKDRVFLLGIILTVGLFVFQTTSTRREAMVDVISRSRHATANVYDHETKPLVPDSASKDDTKRLSA